MKLDRTAAVFAALAIGVAQMYLLAVCWSYIAIHNPLPSWLIGQGVRGIGFKASLFVTDFAISVLLCIPAAALILRLRPRNLFFHLLLAIIPPLLWQNRLLLGGEPTPVSFTNYLPGLLSELFVLPIAVLILLRIKASVAPNNSFKPNLLRSTKRPA